MDDFDIGALDALDEGIFKVRHPVTKARTTWEWTFYGPGHAKTIELADKKSRDALRELAEQRQARVNGKEWTEEPQSADQLRAETIASIVARTKTFTPVKINGETIEFSLEAATKLLADRRKSWLFNQIVEYLRDEASFIQPSATS
jgi:hypothetical protein